MNTPKSEVSNRKVNVAVVGLGFMGITHIKAYQQIESARLVTVCDAVRLPVNGVLAGVSGNISGTDAINLGSDIKVCRQLEEVLADPAIELVDLCVPTPLHAPQAIAALHAGKHVICEKPLARTSRLARDIVNAAKSAKGFFMPAMCMRFWPGWAWLKELAEKSTYGKVLAARFRRVSAPPGWSRDSYFKGIDSGGALLDLHIHDTDFVQFLFGRPLSVFSTGLSRFSGAIDHVVTQYKVAGGATVYAEGSWLLTQGFGMSYTVMFERATIDFDSARGADALRVDEEGQPSRTVKSDAPDGYGGELRHMIQAIQSGKPPTVVAAQDGLSAVEICEAEEKSVNTGQVVSLWNSPADDSFVHRLLRISFTLLLVAFSSSEARAAKEIFYPFGAARIDITPDYPVRLSGYGARSKESEGVDQHLFAKALAMGSDKDGVALLLTVDNLAVPEYVREELLRRLARRPVVWSEQLALCSSHTHTAPMLKDVCPTLFGVGIPPEHQSHIDRYTRELTDNLEQVARAALKDRKPARLAWGQTQAGFAANRRTAGGPTDHDLPVLVATDKSGKIRAVLVNYACHCTTLGDTPNHICGDWAGYAQEYLERDHPGAVALVAIGCGADSNPKPRTGLDFAKQHGQAVATAVSDLLARKLSPLRSKLDCRAKRMVLPFDTPLTREEWEKRAQSDNHWVAYHAKRNLARLDRGEKLPTELPYLVQTWNFGGELAMVFLGGEVVVDYSLRLKKEFDPARLWVNAYANDVPCYIPSKRIWHEGGYEGGLAMIYFDRPTRFTENVEDLIIAAVHDLLPKEFLSGAKN